MNRKQKRIRLKNLNKQQKQSKLRKRIRVVSFLDSLNKIFSYNERGGEE